MTNLNITNNLQIYFKNEISCIFSTDDNYAPYLGIAIQSLIENSNTNNNYGVYVLEENLSEKYKKKLLDLEKENIKIFFVNLSEVYKKHSNDIFFTWAHFTKAIYNRCFIPEIFKNFEKVLYFDCDLIFQRDIADLYNTNLEDKYAGVVRDTGFIYNLNKQNNNLDFVSYTKKFLKLKESKNYFNSGVMLFNIKALTDFKFTEKFIDTLKNFKNLNFPDQDVLNILFENKTMFLNFAWNVELGVFVWKDHKEVIKNEEYSLSLIKPYILHFTGEKPWNNPDLPYAEAFFKYARSSIFYEEVLYKATERKIQDFTKDHLKYYHPNGLNKIFSIKNKYSNGKKEKFITVFGFTFVK